MNLFIRNFILVLYNIFLFLSYFQFNFNLGFNPNLQSLLLYYYYNYYHYLMHKPTNFNMMHVLLGDYPLEICFLVILMNEKYNTHKYLFFSFIFQSWVLQILPALQRISSPRFVRKRMYTRIVSKHTHKQTLSMMHNLLAKHRVK
jgi:hypothetical protein